MGMMNVWALIAIIMGISTVAWLINPTYTQFGTVIQTYQNGVNPVDALFVALQQLLTNWQNSFALAAGIFVGTVFGGNNLLAVVPFALAMLLFNLLVFPTALFASLPAPVGLLINMFFNISMMLALIDFMRSG